MRLHVIVATEGPVRGSSPFVLRRMSFDLPNVTKVMEATECADTILDVVREFADDMHEQAMELEHNPNATSPWGQYGG
jgi:hypothetical protein